MHPIGHIDTPFKEKFGIPRQSLLVTEAWGKITFEKNDFFMEAFRGIENFSHLWLIFSFHEAVKEGHKALVRPPRFQGKEKWGVFASRSPHRPNHLGLSVVKFESIDFSGPKIVLTVSGVDLVKGTPILDIKPYVAYSDAIMDAKSGPFAEIPQKLLVEWLVDEPSDLKLKLLIEEVIALDPRPSFDREDEFGVSVAGFNVRFKMEDKVFKIIQLIKE